MRDIAKISVENTPQKAEPIKIKYCLYARKSTEQEDKQALSIESQVNEMLALAKREELDVVEIKRESHSSKAVGQRPIYNEMLSEIKQGKFNGILLTGVRPGMLRVIKILFRTTARLPLRTFNRLQSALEIINMQPVNCYHASVTKIAEIKK